MVYEWEQHREICYSLYVEQKKSLDEVAEYLRLRYNFTPSRRSYQLRFNIWKFPPKQNVGIKNPQLVERVKELWQKNLTDRETLRVLVEEDGFQIEGSGLASLRRRLGLRLREPGFGFGLSKHIHKKKKRSQRQAPQEEDSTGDSDGSSSEDPGDSEDESEGEQEGGAELPSGPGPAEEPSLAIPVPALSPEELAAVEARREQRKQAFEAESRERWATKKRRRRTKSYGGLPADPPCPPRYPSETTLDEAKVILQLDAEAYQTFRKSFQTICKQAGVLKKTIAGPEKWESLKEQLIRESMHLRSCMWDKNDIDKKKLAIDIIACDVTKRMRIAGTKLSVASAKTILDLNPDQGREVRAALYSILAQEKFTSKHAEGPEHWQEIKRKWYASSELLTGLGALEQADGDAAADPDRHRKLRALEFLARDATRRYREDVWTKGKNVLGPLNVKPAVKKTPAADVRSSTPEESDDAVQLAPLSSIVSSPPTPARKRPAPKSRSQPARRGTQAQPQPQHHTGSRLAPLPAAAAGIASQAVDLSSQLDTTHMLLPPQTQHTFVTNHQYTVPVQGYAPSVPQAAPVYHQHQHQHQHQPHAPQPQSTSMAVFFKLHPGSALSMVGPTMWISTIESRSAIAQVRAAAVEKYPGAICFAIEGIVKDGKGGELPLPVNDEMELEAYLQHISGNANVTGHSAAPTFVVQLMV